MFSDNCPYPVCTLQADFSRVSGEYALPCKIALDLSQSRIQPAEGKKQRFVYRIQPTGKAAAGLNVVFYLCNGVSAADFASMRAFTETGPLPESCVYVLPGGRALLVDSPLSESGLILELTTTRIHPAGEAAVGFLGKAAKLPICSAG